MKKFVYICHPVTTGGKNLTSNLRLIDIIRRYYVKFTNYIPIVPTDIMRDVYPPEGDQEGAYRKAIHYMKACHEIHVWGDWRNSNGCKHEVVEASVIRMPVEHYDANPVEEEIRLLVGGK